MDYMFSGASSFNGVSGWNVSSVTDMTGTFSQASDFNQPLVESARATSPTGITLTMSEIVNSSGTGPNGFAVSTTGTAVTVSSIGGSNSDTLVLTLSGSISDADTITVSYGTGDVRDLASKPADGPGIVGGMSAQNAFLNAHNSTYGIGTGPDSDHFEITGGNLLNLTSVDPGQDAYTANVTASGDDVFESGNNWRLLEVTASSTNLAPTVRAGPDLVLAEGAEFALGGSATDPNGDDLTYSWSQSPATPAVAFSNASSPVAAITLPQVEEDATVTLTLTASDTSSASASDSPPADPVDKGDGLGVSHHMERDGNRHDRVHTD